MPKKKHNFEAHFVKSNDYRTNYASGFYGGFTNVGKFHMSYYVERAPIPKSIDMSIDVDENGVGIGSLIEGKKKGKEGVVRETQGGIIMDIEVAKSMVTWLSEKISEFELLKNSKI